MITDLCVAYLCMELCPNHWYVKRIYLLWICILNTDDPLAVLVLVLVLEPQVLDNNTGCNNSNVHKEVTETNIKVK